MYKKVLWGLFVALAIAQIGVPVATILRQENILKAGDEFKFRTQPVDPFDAFRGRYVALSIEEASAANPANLVVKPGQPVFALIEVGKDGFARFLKIALKPPLTGPYLKCRVDHEIGNTVFLHVPIDRYYMEETKAPAAERLYFRHSTRQRRDAYVVVTIKGGVPVVRKLYVGGKPIEEALKEPPEKLPPLPRPVPQPGSRPPDLSGPIVPVMQPPDSELPDLNGWTIIYPSEADAQSCQDSTGKIHPTTGPDAARWFHWGGCGSMKGYDVTPGREIILYAYGDDCPSCVCYSADFRVYEQQGKGWVSKKFFDLPRQPGLHIPVRYTPGSAKIRIQAPACFYLDVYVKK